MGTAPEYKPRLPSVEDLMDLEFVLELQNVTNKKLRSVCILVEFLQSYNIPIMEIITAVESVQNNPHFRGNKMVGFFEALKQSGCTPGRHSQDYSLFINEYYATPGSSLFYEEGAEALVDNMRG